MARNLLILLLAFLLTNCIVKKKTSYGKKRSITVEASEEKTSVEEVSEPEIVVSSITTKADAIINTALTYSGVKYKYGGTTRKGMDCSGLLYVSFNQNEVTLPRVSFEMAGEGKKIRLEKVKKGDLLFFKTSRKGKRINQQTHIIGNQMAPMICAHCRQMRRFACSFSPSVGLCGRRLSSKMGTPERSQSCAKK